MRKMLSIPTCPLEIPQANEPLRIRQHQLQSWKSTTEYVALRGGKPSRTTRSNPGILRNATEETSAHTSPVETVQARAKYKTYGDTSSGIQSQGLQKHIEAKQNQAYIVTTDGKKKNQANSTSNTII